MTFRTPIVRARSAALIACTLIAAIVPLSAVAEQGIAPGSGAVVTAGQPLLVRATPGWDAEVSYEIADGSSVTVWDVAQTAPDGSLWYPIDGGFVPVDGVTSLGSLEGGIALYQETAPEAVAEAWVEPAPEEWVEPAASEGWVDPNTGEWVEPTATDAGWVDPNTGAWVEPAAEEWVEPAPTEEWVEPAPAEMVNTGGPEAWGEPIGTAYISGSNGDGAVCRAGAERGTDRLAVLGEGEAVEVRGEAVGEWQPVNCAGIGGYVHASLISWEPVASAVADETAPLDEEQGRRKGNRGGNAGNDGTASASGNQIANFAMQYQGYPYVYAGEGPYAFDCSGFTKFVVQNTLGMDITHDMFAQYDMGQQVSRDELQPGDLVFFANTFRPGMSHNGIYIGNGQMIHAENEQTGVKISDINSDYYSSRWFGAVRFT